MELLPPPPPPPPPPPLLRLRWAMTAMPTTMSVAMAGSMMTPITPLTLPPLLLPLLPPLLPLLLPLLLLPLLPLLPPLLLPLYVQQKSLLPLESGKFVPHESLATTDEGLVPGVHWYAYELSSHGNPGNGSHAPPVPGQGKQQ